MYVLEKIGTLILITLEGILPDEEIEEIKEELKQIVEEEDEAVMSLNTKPIPPDRITPKMDDQEHDLVRFCENLGIRIYSYRL